METMNKVIGIVKANMENIMEVKPESNFIKDLKTDSFDMLMIMSGIEDEFQINISEEDFESILTVEDIVFQLNIKLGLN